MQLPRDLVPDYGTSSRIAEIQALVQKGFPLSRRSQPPARPSYSVYDVAPRTTCGWGLSADELERISGSIHHLYRSSLPCLYVVLGDALLDMPEGEAREAIRAFTSRVVREQDRAGLPPYWLRVLESEGGIHANLVFPATAEMQRSLAASTAFADYLQRDNAIQPVYDFNELARVYLSKERPPNVQGGSKLGPRRKGSHKLGEGEGDRVQLSRALRDDALAAGLIKPWQRTKAKVLVRGARIEPVATTIILPEPITVTVPVLPTVEAVQLSLFQTPPMQDTLRDAVRQFREEQSMTQSRLYGMLGIGRSHGANFERGHDGLSPPRRRLLRHVMETGRLAA
jgi:DNA-binding transcriptional regulator YiaG